jgi:hypothetical protein
MQLEIIGELEMTKKEKIYCDIFKCMVDKTRGNICCCSCPYNKECLEKCLNSPEKCRVSYKDYKQN